MNKIEKYNYDEFKKDLPKYVVYIVDKNDKFHKVLTTGKIKKKNLISILENKYKNTPYEFFIVFKFGFHTGMKPLQGGPLSITISSLVFNDANKLVSGYTKDKKYKNIHGKVWFQRKYLNVNGWSDDYLDCIVENLLNGKVKLLPLVVNMFNVDFGDRCKKKEKPKTYKIKDENNELKNLINQIEETKINKPIDTKELKEKIKLIESFFKPTNKKDDTHSINDVINLMEEVKRTKINNKIDKDEINKLIKQLEEKKEEPKKYKKSKDDNSDHPLSDFILNNSHLFSSRF